MARVYSPTPDHNCDYGVDFIHGAAVVPDADTARRAWFVAKGYTVVAGKDALSIWDKLPIETLALIAPLFGIDPTGKAKSALAPAIDAVTSAHVTIEIAAFDEIADVPGGTLAAPTYTNAAAVIAALPETVLATIDGAVAEVPVTTWVDTDTYNKLVAGSYTFTATLGEVPAPFANTAGVTAVVDVVVAAS